ncbi:MAG TPA: hypothetical protein PKO33_14440, partial [Pyrinomonadaceae bacterium]|nr:hypothetical protein [Pyrinomonadaceae bacterium]
MLNQAGKIPHSKNLGDHSPSPSWSARRVSIIRSFTVKGRSVHHPTNDCVGAAKMGRCGGPAPSRSGRSRN